MAKPAGCTQLQGRDPAALSRFPAGILHPAGWDLPVPLKGQRAAGLSCPHESFGGTDIAVLGVTWLSSFVPWQVGAAFTFFHTYFVFFQCCFRQ